MVEKIRASSDPEDGSIDTLGTQEHKGKGSVLFSLNAKCQTQSLAHSL